MRHIIPALLASASVASAGGYVAPITDAPPVPRPAQAAAHNWTGTYVGLSYGTQRSKSQRATYEDRELTETRRETRPYTKRDLHHDLKQTGCEHPGSKFELTNGSTIGTVPCASVLNAKPNPSWDDWSVVGHAPVIVREWDEVVGSETIQTGTETYRQSDSTAGVFAGYRHQMVGGTVWGVEAHYANSAGGNSLRAMGQAGYAIGRALPYITLGRDFDEKSTVYGAGLDVALGKHLISGVLYTKSDNASRIDGRIGWRW